ncbi:MAG: RagB/SusD family nutrient uptake outer membrane protein [Paludibacter sp.]|jgi:hypothetical protein|nr:RagB/SusD family nutrient uptake outer membrane protein [Paludibacter sp.]
MKRAIRNIGFTLLILLSPACSDFLQVENPSQVTDDFYNTKKGQEALLVDIYSKFRSVYGTGEFQYFGTDLYMAITESPIEKMFNGYDASFNGTAGLIFGYWSNLYKIIQQSNILLNRIQPDTEGMTPADYASLTAQTRFLRSLAYYYLTETFGPVPLLTEENQELITAVTRNSETELYTFMINELEEIQDVLPARSAESGRVSNAAVLQFLGKLYLTRAYRSYAQPDDFTKAASAFEKVIQIPEYELQPTFASVFDELNQNNSEVIWSIQYGSDKNYYGGGNSQQSIFGFNITALNPDMFVASQSDYSFMERYYWINPKVHELFTDPVADSRYDASFQREFYINNPANSDKGRLGIYFPRWNDTSDDSKNAVLYYPFRKNNEYYWYPQSSSMPALKDAADKMPILKKFRDTKMLWKGAGTREDVVMRLADTYLLCAEAYLGANNEQKALDKVNSIRSRAARTQADAAAMRLASLNLDILMDERARELLGEHDRWFDLKRCGLLISRAKAYNPYVQKYNNLNEDHLVRPIPQDEIDRLSGLTQNKGY